MFCAYRIIGAIIVNPWDTEDVAQAIFDAVVMSEDAKRSKHDQLYKYVTKYTAAFWGESFVKELTVIIDENRSQCDLNCFVRESVWNRSKSNFYQKLKNMESRRCLQQLNKKGY
jgi:trehalose-6-phosphate synthase